MLIYKEETVMLIAFKLVYTAVNNWDIEVQTINCFWVTWMSTPWVGIKNELTNEGLK
jgi:hypothetical protein